MKPSKNEPIAIVGLGCVLPGARGPRDYWENILSRRREFRRIPDKRLRRDDYFDDSGGQTDKAYQFTAALFDGFVFDWARYRIPKPTFAITDMVQWLALDVAAQALEDAGYSSDSVPRERTGVFVGDSDTGESFRTMTLRLRWPFVRRTLLAATKAHRLPEDVQQGLCESMEQLYKSVFPAFNEDLLAGNLGATIAGRICNYFDLHGGGCTVDAACASSLVAVNNACDLLSSRQLDLALAGGVDISLDPYEMVGFCLAGAFSRGDITPYDNRAGGFLPGEGCGFVVLRRLEDARAAGQSVYAVIRGWGMSSDGRGGIMQPTRDGQASAIRRAYDGAPYGVDAPDFIEGHGTGTKVGDRTELESFALALEEASPPTGRRYGIGSVKSIIGHTKAAAGLASLIKATMAVNRRVIPATAACDQPNAAFHGAAHRLFPLTTGEVRDPDAHLRAGVSAFGFGGINAHITLESGDAPNPRIAPRLEERALLSAWQDSELFVFGAVSTGELARRVESVAREAEQLSQSDLTDMAAECSRRVTREDRLRAGVIASDPSKLMARLSELAELLRTSPPRSGELWGSPDEMTWIGRERKGNRIGFVFPGQGSQQLRMGEWLVERFSWARDLVSSADKIMAEFGGPAISSVFLRPTHRATSDEISVWETEIRQTEVAQPTICLVSVLYSTYLSHLGLMPSVVGGHSLGELTAFHVAGALSFEELMRLSILRGRLMMAAPERPGAMASLSCDRARAEGLLARIPGQLVVANLNSADQVVISGEQSAIQELVVLASSEGLSAKRLPVSNAFHSQLVANAAARLKDELRTWKVSPHAFENIRLFSCMETSAAAAPAIDRSVELAEHFAAQIVSPVNFVAFVERLKEHSDLLFEVGPGRVLSNLVRNINGARGPLCLPLASQPLSHRDLNIAVACAFAGGSEIKWSALFENRMVRPFVQTNDRTFLDSVLERPFAVEPLPVSAGDVAPMDGLAPRLASMGVPREQLESYLSRRLGFLTRVIEADISSGSPDAITHSASMGQGLAHAWVGQPPPGPSGELASGTSAEGILVELIASRTGYPRESITPASRLINDLNIDSIKSGEIIAAAAKQWGVAGKVDPSRFSNASIREIADELRRHGPGSVAVVQPTPASLAPATAGPVGNAEGILIGLIASKTGYPPESITHASRLINDLNIDSIKSGEIIAAAAKQWGVVGKVDPSRFANASIRDIADELRRHGPGAASPSGEHSPPTGSNDVLETVLHEAEQLTGFQRDVVRPEAHTARDLGLDGIRVSELMARIAADLGVPRNFDVEPFRNRTLADIAAVFDAMRRRRAGLSLPVNEGISQSWVRNFGVEVIPEPLPAGTREVTRRTEDDWSNANVLVVCEGADATLVQQLEAHLATLGASVHILGFEHLGSLDDFQARSFSHLILVLPSEVRARQEPAFDSLVRAFGRLSSVSRVARKDTPDRRRNTVGYVQFGGGYFGQSVASAGIESSCATGFARCLHLERPDLRVRVIDLSSSLDVTRAVRAIADELMTPEAFNAAGYDVHGTRRAWRLVLQRPGAYPTRRIPWTPDDVLLVTGGGRGVTAECALGLARATGAAVALVGRTPEPGHGPNTDASASELGKTLTRFSQEGIRFRYYACDVTEPHAVATMVSRVRSELGPITGVLHGAMVLGRHVVSTIVAEEAAVEVSPKLLGAINLWQALASTPPKMFAALTSIVTHQGMPGSAAYAFSNEALDLVMRRLATSEPRTAFQCVAFGVWGQVGEAARIGTVQVLRRSGLDVAVISPDEGVGRLVHLWLSDPGNPHVVVTVRSRGYDTWRQVRGEMSTVTGLRFVEELKDFEPGVELLAEAHLSLQSDRYLEASSHDGSCLFPLVFQMEAAAQGAWFAAGPREGWGVRRMESLEIRRAIAVTSGHDTTIHISSEVQENSTNEEVCVRVAIRSDEDNFSEDCFTALVVVGPLLEAPQEEAPLLAAPLPLTAASYVRNNRLPLAPFLRIGPIYSVAQDRLVWACESPEERAAVSNRLESGQPDILGDPFARVALLTSCLMSDPDRLWAVQRLERIEFYVDSNAVSHRICVARVDSKADQRLNASARAVSVEGRVLERVTGLEYHLVPERSALPQVTTVASLEPGRAATAVEDDAQTVLSRLPSWIRSFGSTLAEEPLRKEAAVRWSGARVLLLCDSGDTPLMGGLQAILSEQGASVSVRPLTDDAVGDFSRNTHIVAILDEPRISASNPRQRLEHILRRVLNPALLAVRLPTSSLIYVQRGGMLTGLRESGLQHVLAIGKSMCLERRGGGQVRVIQLHPDLWSDECANLLLEEMAAGGIFAAAGYDARRVRRVPKLVLEHSHQLEPRKRGLSEGDVIFATGGGKGLTLECILPLALRTGAQVAIAGRTSWPGLSQSGSRDAVLEANLGRLAQHGVRFHYYSCDISDAEACRDTVTAIQAEMGPIAAVIHGAGLGWPRPLEHVHTDQALEEVAPKVLGAINICETLASAPPRLLVGFTSMVNHHGMPGLVVYGYSNDAMVAVFSDFGAQHPETDVQITGFGACDVGLGRGAPASVRRLGGGLLIDELPHREVGSRFVELLERAPEHQHVFVTSRCRGFPAWDVQRPVSPAKDLRFIDRIIFYEHDVEFVGRTTLSVNDDPYLKDHVYNGLYVLPTAMGFEIAAQAATYVTGGDKSVLRIESVEMPWPIVIDPTSGQEIEVRTQVLEPTTPGPRNERRVRVGIASEQSGFTKEYFVSEVILGTPADPEQMEIAHEGEVLAIDPKLDLYGTYFFHGPDYQRIRTIVSANENRVVFWTEHDRRAASGQGVFGGARPRKLVLGDPYLRDSLVHGQGLADLQSSRGFTQRIKRVEFFPHTCESERRLCEVRVQRRFEKGAEDDLVMTDGSGRLLERYTGYEFKVLELTPHLPSMSELVQRKSAARNDEKTFPGATPPPSDRAAPMIRMTADVSLGCAIMQDMFNVDWMAHDAISGHVTPTQYVQWFRQMFESVHLYVENAEILSAVRDGQYLSVMRWLDVRLGEGARLYDRVHGRAWAARVSPESVVWSADFGPLIGDKYAHVEAEYFLVRKGEHSYVDIYGEFAAKNHVSGNVGGLVPSRNTRVLARDRYHASLVDCDLSGHVNSATYVAWQMRVRDEYLHSLDPQLTQRGGAMCRCRGLHIKYLREVLPFQDVEIEMNLDHTHGGVAQLRFDYFQAAKPDQREKVAVGSQQIEWRRAVKNQGDAVALPDQLREAWGSDDPIVEAPTQTT